MTGVQTCALPIWSVSRTMIGLGWKRGNGSGCMAVCLKGTSGNLINPVNDPSFYTAKDVFGQGTSIGTGNTTNYVVYKGTGTVIGVSGLTKNTQYTFKVYEYCYNSDNSLFSYATNNTSDNLLTRNTSPKTGFDPEWFDTQESNLVNARIYPIPANEILNLSVTLQESSNLSVELYNIQGEKLFVPVENVIYQKGNYEIPILLNNFASGNYYLVISGNNELVIQDFIIAH